MNIFSFAKDYADQIGGQFTDYDHTKGIVVVPVNDGRFQTVLIVSEKSSKSGKMRAVFSSKVGEFNSNIDALRLLEQMANFEFSKFVIEGKQLIIVASCLTDTATVDEAKLIMQEVATIADEYELKLTGKDVY